MEHEEQENETVQAQAQEATKNGPTGTPSDYGEAGTVAKGMVLEVPNRKRQENVIDRIVRDPLMWTRFQQLVARGAIEAATFGLR